MKNDKKIVNLVDYKPKWGDSVLKVNGVQKAQQDLNRAIRDLLDNYMDKPKRGTSWTR